MMLALHQVAHRHRHVVAEVVETELVVCTECDVACICLAARLAVRLVLVDAVYRETMEHVERSHPLRVSLREVVVDCDYMHSLACQRIEEHRESRHEGLTLSRRHLGDLSLMENDTADELHVIVDHVPCDLVSSGHPVVLPDGIVTLYPDKLLGGAEVAVKLCRLDHDLRIFLETACCRLHDRKRLRQNLFENLLYGLVDFLHKLVRLCGERFLLLDWKIFLQIFRDLRDALLVGCDRFADLRLELIALCSELVVVKLVYLIIRREDLGKHRLELLEVPLGLCSEYFLEQVSKSHILSFKFHIFTACKNSENI